MAGIFSGPKAKVLPPPSKEERDKELIDRTKKIRRDTEQEIARQRGLGPIQLRAPTLRY